MQLRGAYIAIMFESGSPDVKSMLQSLQIADADILFFSDLRTTNEY